MIDNDIIQPPKAEQPAEKKSNIKIALIIIAAVFVVFLLYYLIMALMAPSSSISSINTEYGYKETDDKKIDQRLFSDSAFVALNREKAYNQARITMAESDSICLSLNLSDSTATLEIKGVAVHKTKMSRINITKVLNKADEYAVTSMLSVPFTINNHIASIKKEPVMLKIAPKDTSEYKPDIAPDTTKRESVNYMLEMDNGFRIYVYQEGGERSAGALGRFLFDLNDRFKNSFAILKGMLSFKVPEYHPSIRIRLPEADAKIIFRAIPRHGQIAVFR